MPRRLAAPVAARAGGIGHLGQTDPASEGFLKARWASLDFTPVPEPGRAALVLAGRAVLVARAAARCEAA